MNSENQFSREQTSPFEARKEAPEWHAGWLDLAYDAVVVRDYDGRIRYWNKGAETLYGWTQQEASGKIAHDLLRSIFPASFEKTRESLRSTGQWEGEVRCTAAGGGMLVVSSRWSVRQTDGEPPQILQIDRDITAQKRVEEGFRGINRELELRVSELRRSEQLFRGLLESAPDSIVIVRPGGEIAMVNAETERQFGYSRDELLGCDVEMLMPERFRRGHLAQRRGYESQPRTRPLNSGLELYARRKNGEEFPVEISLSPLHTASCDLISSAIRDVSERKGMQDALRERNRQLELEIADRRQTERQLVERNQDLASTIAERTKELEAARLRLDETEQQLDQLARATRPGE